MAANRASYRRLALRYSDALLTLALDAKAEDAVLADMKALSDAVHESEAFARLLSNPIVSVSDKKKVLDEIAKQGKAHKLSVQFLSTLAEEGRLPILPQIAALMEQKLSAARGEAHAHVVSARPLKKKHITDIEKALKAATGKPVSMTTEEDASLLGGVRITLGSRMLDHSVAGKLQRLQQRLSGAAA